MLGPQPFFEALKESSSPYINRFLSADTIVPNPANPQSLNRYSYVINNPLRYTDPSGHRACGPEEGISCETGLSNNPPDHTNIGCGGGLHPCLGNSPNKDKDKDKDKSNTSDVAAMATVLDTIATGFNGVYAMVGDVVGLVCKICYGAVVTLYWPYSFIPNSISSVAMGLWIADGAQTGENSLTLPNASTGTDFSVSVSQDTIVAVVTNALGWIVLKEPNSAFFVDAAVAGYDYGRLGTIPFVPTIPAAINPTITYNTNTGLNFSLYK